MCFAKMRFPSTEEQFVSRLGTLCLREKVRLLFEARVGMEQSLQIAKDQSDAKKFCSVKKLISLEEL